jgi:hypothetical protein
VRATELTDLGQGLAYLRVQAFRDTAGVVISNAAGSRPLVLDLRYATAAAGDATTLTDVLARRSVGGPLFVLVGPATPPALASVLAAHPGKCTTLGIKGSAPAPKVVVEQSADLDRRAYEAGATGTPLSALLSGRIVKERYDEAALVKDFSNGNPRPEPPPTPDPTVKKTTGPPPEPPLTDRVLQRAVHLHRALLALGRLPRAA